MSESSAKLSASERTHIASKEHLPKPRLNTDLAPAPGETRAAGSTSALGGVAGSASPSRLPQHEAHFGFKVVEKQQMPEGVVVSPFLPENRS